MKWSALPLAVALTLPCLAQSAFAAPGCVGCHGDATAMKALVKPPSAGSSEGEG